MSPTRLDRTFAALTVLVAFGLAGCASHPAPSVRQTQDQFSKVSRTYQPDRSKRVLPTLRPDSPPSDFFRFALLAHPQVESAYFDWRASVASIQSATALPDPQLTFQADIVQTLTSLMPGLMFDLMAPRKRAAMGAEAAATSETAHRQFTASLSTVASNVRRAWVDLEYIDAALEVRRDQINAIHQAAAIANANYSTGRGMGSLEAQTKWANQEGRILTEIASLEDRRTAARARFKSALGIPREAADPAFPSQSFPSAPLPDEATLWQHILAANPDLAAMRSMVDMAAAQLVVARQARTPDFTAGLMVDLKMNPLLYRPTATMTLPIWRAKIEATLASYQAKQQAAAARVSSEQLRMAADLAQMLFMVRDADRMLAYLEHTALPNLDRAIASASAAYQTGMAEFDPLTDLRLMQLAMQSERVEARRERAAALADLSQMVATGLPLQGLADLP